MNARRWLSRAALAIAASGMAVLAFSQADTIVVAAFSALKPGAALPEPFKPLNASSSVPRTRYTLVEDNGITVLRADANAAASGISRAVRVNPAEFPVLRWRWKITNVLKQSDLATKSGDDFPARIYVMFDYPLEKLSFADRTKIRLARALHDPNLPTATLCYVWDGKAAAGTIAPSAYTDRVRVLVVESGASRVNQWLAVERNIAADFKAAFGDEAPAVSAVAIATDTDNTGESATAFFGDISFNKQQLKKHP